MPKMVDRDARRDDIGRAVWRVLNGHGMGELSIRSVAVEAKIPPSTLQHYFATREDLLSHALQLSIAEQSRRLETKEGTGQIIDQVTEAWCQTLPLDEIRRTEANVWFSAIVTLRGGVHRKVLDEAEEGLDHLAQWSVTALTGRSHPAEATRLRAFMDGLAVNALSRPERFPKADLLSQVTGYLSDLAERLPSLDVPSRDARTLENLEVKGVEL